MIYLTRRESFNAAHKLFREDWSADRNREVFGKCSNPNWHGHNYVLYITVKGKPDVETGYVIDLKSLSRAIHACVIDDLDHKNLNLDVSWMKGVIPSTENLAVKIWERLEPAVRETGCELHCVKVCETEKNFVEYFGE